MGNAVEAVAWQAIGRLARGADAVLSTLPPLPAGQMPNLNPHNGGWTGGPTQFWGGFLAGKLWLLHALTGDAAYLRGAIDVVRSLAPLAEIPHIDTGFALYYGACLGSRSAVGNELRDLALRGAASMMRLYHPEVRAFLVRPRNGAIAAELAPLYEVFHPRELLIDTGATLPLVMWAARVRPEYADAVNAHFDTYRRRGLIREDGTAMHALDFSETWAPGTPHTHQGYGPGTLWTRGQAWAALGHVEAFRATGQRRYLEVAKRCASCFFSRLGTRIVPPFDFDAPEAAAVPEDTCSTTIMMNAVLQMPPDETPPEWRRFVERSVEELTRNYLTPGGLLLHGCWGGLWGRAGESIMPYGNYFLTEALYRLLRPHDDLWGW